MEKIKREKLLIRLHTNSSFEGTVESLRLSMLKTCLKMISLKLQLLAFFLARCGKITLCV